MAGGNYPIRALQPLPGGAGAATGGADAANGHGANGANGHGANGTNGHGANGANGHGVNGTNGHDAASARNGHLGAGHGARLRDGVSFVARRAPGAAPRFLVKSPDTDTVLEFGATEYFLCRQLDGHASAGEIAERYARRFGRPLGPEDVEAFLRQLGDHGLLDGVAAHTGGVLSDFLAPEALFPAPRIWLRNGNRVFAGLARRLRWCFTTPAHVVAGAIVFLAVAVFLPGFWDFVAAVDGRIDLAFAAMCFVCTSIIPSVRMLAHGIVAKRYGAQVNDAGLLLFFYFSPSFFCDVSSAGALRHRRQRAWVIGAALYAQVVVWAVATLAWFVTTPEGVPNSWWLALSFTSGLGLLLSAMNPLMKMQGYFLLATLLDIPRLYERSVDRLYAAVTGRGPAEPATARERRWFLAYGLLSVVYVVAIIVVPLFWMASSITATFDHGGGAVAVLAVAVFAGQRPLTRGLDALRRRWGNGGGTNGGGMNGGRTRGSRRWVWRIGLGLAFVILMFIPYPYETGGPFSIIPSERTEIHCEIDGGRITKVFVKEGETVKKGQPIAEIDKRQYERNVALYTAQLEADGQKLRLLYKDLALLANPPNIETVRALEAEVGRLKTSLADARRQMELTTLRAPMDGRVTTPLIEQAVGKYVKEGDLVATVEEASAVRVEIQVPEADAPQVQKDARVKIVAWAYPMTTFEGRVKEIAPIALSPPGSTTVTTKSVRVVAEIPNPDLRLKTQLTGYAKIRTEWIPVWLVLGRLLLRWFAVQVWYWLP